MSIPPWPPIGTSQRRKLTRSKSLESLENYPKINIQEPQDSSKNPSSDPMDLGWSTQLTTKKNWQL